MEEEVKLKPSEIPCPKCGSAAIARSFYKKGADIRSLSYGEKPSPHSSGMGTYYWKSTKDHILNHCTCCQYDWAIEPLRQKRGS